MATTVIVEAVNRLLKIFEDIPDSLPPGTTDETVADAINAIVDDAIQLDKDRAEGIPDPVTLSAQTRAGCAKVAASLASRFGYGKPGGIFAANMAAHQARQSMGSDFRTDAEVRRDLLARGIKTFPRIQPRMS